MIQDKGVQRARAKAELYWQNNKEHVQLKFTNAFKEGFLAGMQYSNECCDILHKNNSTSSLTVYHDYTPWRRFLAIVGFASLILLTVFFITWVVRGNIYVDHVLSTYHHE